MQYGGQSRMLGTSITLYYISLFVKSLAKLEAYCFI